VEILSGTGYLISEFLSPLTNTRNDEYGGSLKNRMRFGVNVVTAVRNTLGPEYPLIIRMNGNDFMPGGQSPIELQEYAKALVACGVDALCINVGWHEARVPQIISSVPRGVYAYLARGIKEKVVIPVIASHRINDPGTARKLIVDGMCDMVAMGRSLIADPLLPQKTQSGHEHEIIHCIACAQGCFDNLFKLKAVECLCNPKVGREGNIAQPLSTPKKIMVIGGGPAGMSAALAASEKGHSVTLYEQNNRLGGQLHLAGSPPGREEFINLAKDLESQLRTNSIKIMLGQKVDRTLIQQETPDAVILATGAIPTIPPIEGVNAPHVVQAWDVLMDKVITGQRVVVIGGGAVGVETALFLAEKGTLNGDAVKFLLVNRAESPETLYELATQGTKKITIIEMVNRVGQDIGKSTRWAMMQDIKKLNVDIRLEAKALEINSNGIRIEQCGEVTELPADTVVLATGSVSCNELRNDLKKLDIPYKIIGDANRIGLAFNAVHQGYAAGFEI
jgi:2,4-dienoyl-CoA reductase (NADPH2)